MPKIIASDSVTLTHPVEKVWTVISDIPSYKLWWPKLLNLEINQVNNHIIGTTLKAQPFGGKSFSIRVMEINYPSEIRLEYFEGLYCGYGRWILKNENGMTILTYEVNVDITDSFTKIISYLLPVSRIHSLIFKIIFLNLKKYLENRN